MKKPYLIMMVFALTACFKEDEMVKPHEPGEVETVTIALTKNYTDNVYFDLESGSAVLTTGKMNWDLGFEPGEMGWRIYLNSTRFMQAAPSGRQSFEAVKDTFGLTWFFDVSSGNPDSTAIGRWFQHNGNDTLSKEEVYVIDLGYNASGNVLGYRKMQVIGWNSVSYTIRYANLNGSDETTQVIPKSTGRDIICYSMRNHALAEHERPLKPEWDLWFTQYTTMLFTSDGTPYPYLVTGVLSNRAGGVLVARETGLAFAGIDFEKALGFSYSNQADLIGYDWKFYDFDAGSYSVDPGISYLVRTIEGAYYKLRFIGFYNNMGEKGYPSIEFQRL